MFRERVQNMMNFIKRYKLQLVFGVIALFILASILWGIFYVSQAQQSKEAPLPLAQPTPVVRQSFRVLTTSPSDGEIDVYSGEQVISFTTDAEITSEGFFSLSLKPQPPSSLRFSNTYPSRQIEALVVGGLQPGTTYTAVVKNKYGEVVRGWSFSTSNETPEGSTELAREENQRVIAQYYPLFDHIPFKSKIFDIDYTGRLTLEVIVKNDTGNIEEEVLGWIKSHGVDPSTHKINYIY